jgi:hypothetical protein
MIGIKASNNRIKGLNQVSLLPTTDRKCCVAHAKEIHNNSFKLGKWKATARIGISSQIVASSCKINVDSSLSTIVVHIATLYIFFLQDQEELMGHGKFVQNGIVIYVMMSTAQICILHQSRNISFCRKIRTRRLPPCRSLWWLR